VPRNDAVSRWLWEELSPREKQVARLCLKMKSATIARELGVSRSRVNEVLTTIYRLMNVQDRIELAFLMGQHAKEIDEAP
jgi:DNA-binding NarL/FixJ family response regulator